MSAFKVGIQIDQGATFRKQFVWKSGPKGSETPVDLTDCTARMQIRQQIGDSEVLAELTTENAGIVLGGTTGEVDLYISAVTTAGFEWTEAVYDVEIVFSNGDVRRFVAGAVCVSPEVTRVA